MNGRRPIVEQKRLAFLGCEGDSEHAYGTLLNEIAEDKPLTIHRYRLNPGAGDPRELVKRAIQRIDSQRRLGTRYISAAVLLDEDRCRHDPECCRDARILAAKSGLRLIWQQPDHEAFLLRHLDGCQGRRPPTACLAELQRHWREYTKPMDSRALQNRIGVAQIQNARAVEPELQAFLTSMGW